jgi:probable phosphomutase (TIGR03848 family)
MTILLLVRHGSTTAVGRRLVGRLPGVELSPEGRSEATSLGARLASLPLSAIYCSPLERARATAAEIASPHGLSVTVRDGLTDIDFGEWSGMTFSELDQAPRWRAFNAQRSVTRPPGGEHIAEVQTRMVREVERIQHDHPTETVALVGHADPLKALLGYYMGVPIDLLQRVEIAPASLSVLKLTSESISIVLLNDTGSSSAGW